jgi:hypothetical protein
MGGRFLRLLNFASKAFTTHVASSLQLYPILFRRAVRLRDCTIHVHNELKRFERSTRSIQLCECDKYKFKFIQRATSPYCKRQPGNVKTRGNNTFYRRIVEQTNCGEDSTRQATGPASVEPCGSRARRIIMTSTRRPIPRCSPVIRRRGANTRVWAFSKAVVINDASGLAHVIYRPTSRGSLRCDRTSCAQVSSALSIDKLTAFVRVQSAV